jgi:steroid delta-isomerase-like uncharacterized protein
MRNPSTTALSNWFERAWNQSDRTALDHLLTEDVIANGLADGASLQGKEGFRSFYDDFQSQIKNIHITIEDVVSEDNMECSRCTITGMHVPSNKSIKFSGVCMARIEDNKIAEAWNYFDFLTMYKQIGYTLVEP